MDIDDIIFAIDNYAIRIIYVQQRLDESLCIKIRLRRENTFDNRIVKHK